MDSFKISSVLILALLSCSPDRHSNAIAIENESALASDTIVGRKAITNEIPGAAYRRRSIGYFVIVNSDTSVLTCIFSESKTGESLFMDILYPRRSLSYHQRMTELKKILPEAAKNFKLDSLRTIYLGRLVTNGDITIAVTDQFVRTFGPEHQIRDYEKIGKFLKESKLGTDLNKLFKPYSLHVDKISVEKVFFTSKHDLYWSAKIETDSAAVPDKILDCMTWVRIKHD